MGVDPTAYLRTKDPLEREVWERALRISQKRKAELHEHLAAEIINKLGKAMS